MSRLVIVSNRVTDLETGPQSGGLAVAIGDALRQSGGIWFGWDGSIAKENTTTGLNLTRNGSVTVATVPMTQSEYETYYLGYSNKVLWPAFHYRLDLSAYQSSFIEGYRSVNRRIAETLSSLVTDNDLIWVHDYHLIPLASELRQRGVSTPIGFFLHIPFPPPDVLMAVPDHEWLVQTMFDYDVVGFQTSWDVVNFQRYVEDQAGGIVGQDGHITAFDKTIVVRCFPIGIDVEAFREMARTPEAEEQIDLIRRRTLNRKQILGVDRLDYSKGLPDRLRAFRRLLELYPEYQKRVSFMQIAPPTREEVEAYAEIKQELEGLSGNINGEFGDFDWTPVRYIHRTIPRETLATLFRSSKVGLVTPLRDGMNLVAKEYVAAQDEDDPGVLILSRFAGAAEDLQESLIVNPYDHDEVAKAMRRALDMEVEERIERQKALFQRVQRNDVSRWRKTFLEQLGQAAPGNQL
jgi:trehalose 6-phosphate synthase